DNEIKLRNKIMKLAEIEGKHLGEYYKEKNEKENQSSDDDYTYRVEPCSAIKYSFLDYGNILKGNDNLEPDTTSTGSNLKKIFENISSSNEIGDRRKKFWDENKSCIWRSLLCGYKKGYIGNNVDSSTKELPDDIQTCIIPDDKDNTTSTTNG
ncbi:putative EMP1-like protein, partial [Plasmodium gaboni]